MLPKTFALIDDDTEYTEFLSQYLERLGVKVDVFADSNQLLVHSAPYAYDFYVLDLMLPGIAGEDLLKVLRLRTQAGVLVVSGRLAPDVFEIVISAGADMYLAKPVKFEQVALAVKAVQRRASVAGQAGQSWQLDRSAKQLIVPDGARVDLSDADMTVMECFVDANGEAVNRETLRQRLGLIHEADVTDGLNATIYRLRRRIEKATPMAVPLQSKSRVGYLFRAALQVV